MNTLLGLSKVNFYITFEFILAFRMRDPSVPLRTILQNYLNHVENLETRNNTDSDQYEDEFQKLKLLSESLKSQVHYSTKEGEKDFNRKKNRYKDILPYDYSRVVLTEFPGIPGSDYVNANYIRGASGSMAYIASQGPLVNTICDFWRMVVEAEVKVIIMACNEKEAGKHKCENYWIEKENEPLVYGSITISTIKTRQICPDFLLRTLKIQFTNDKGENEERTVCQFHFSAWPDHGVPTQVRPLLDMVFLVRDVQSSETTPVLVHCSAGCGRTGTICAIDFVWGLFKSGKLTRDFSLFNIICGMRRQRIAMVQTKEQYILVHRAVREMFQEQLRVIDAHPYENIDADGFPFMMHEKKLCEKAFSDEDGRNCTYHNETKESVEENLDAQPPIMFSLFNESHSKRQNLAHTPNNSKLTVVSHSEKVGGFSTVGPIMGKTILMEKHHGHEKGHNTYSSRPQSKSTQNVITNAGGSRGKSTKLNILQLRALFEQEAASQGPGLSDGVKLNRSASSVGVETSLAARQGDKFFRRDDVLSKTMTSRSHPIPPKREKVKLSKPSNSYEKENSEIPFQVTLCDTNGQLSKTINSEVIKKEEKRVEFEVADAGISSVHENRERQLEVKTFPLMKRSKSMKIKRFFENSKDFLIHSWGSKTDPKESGTAYLNLEISSPQTEDLCSYRQVQKVSSHHYEAPMPLIHQSDVSNNPKSSDRSEHLKTKTVGKSALKEPSHSFSKFPENFSFKVQNLRCVNRDTSATCDKQEANQSDASSEEGFYQTPPSDPVCDNVEPLSSELINTCHPVQGQASLLLEDNQLQSNSGAGTQCKVSTCNTVVGSDGKSKATTSTVVLDSIPVRLRERRNSYMQAVDNCVKMHDRKEIENIAPILEETGKTPKNKVKNNRECEIIWFGNSERLVCPKNQISELSCNTQMKKCHGKEGSKYEAAKSLVASDTPFRIVPNPSASIKWFSEEDSCNLTDETKILKVKRGFGGAPDTYYDKKPINEDGRRVFKTGDGEVHHKNPPGLEPKQSEGTCGNQNHDRDHIPLLSSMKSISLISGNRKPDSEPHDNCEKYSSIKPPLPSYKNLEAKFKSPPPWQALASKSTLNNKSDVENKGQDLTICHEGSRKEANKKPQPPSYEEAIKPKIVGETAFIGDAVVKLRPKKDKSVAEADECARPVAPPRVKRNSSSLTCKADLFGGSQPAMFSSELGGDRNSGSRLSRLFRKFGEDEVPNKAEHDNSVDNPQSSLKDMKNECVSLSPNMRKRVEQRESVHLSNTDNTNLMPSKSLSKALGRLHATAVNFKQKFGSVVKIQDFEGDSGDSPSCEEQYNELSRGFPKRFPNKTKGPREPPRSFRPRQEYI